MPLRRTRMLQGPERSALDNDVRTGALLRLFQCGQMNSLTHRNMETITKPPVVSEVKHRIAVPNSRPRLIKLVGVGVEGARVAQGMASLELQGVNVVIPDFSSSQAVVAMLQSLTEADMIVAVACAGDDLTLAPLIKQAVRRSSVMVTGIFIQEDHGPTAHESLAILRPSCDMLVIASDESYVVDMLVELGA